MLQTTLKDLEKAQKTIKILKYIAVTLFALLSSAVIFVRSLVVDIDAAEEKLADTKHELLMTKDRVSELESSKISLTISVNSLEYLTNLLKEKVGLVKGTYTIIAGEVGVPDSLYHE